MKVLFVSFKTALRNDGLSSVKRKKLNNVLDYRSTITRSGKWINMFKFIEKLFILHAINSTLLKISSKIFLGN